MRKLGLLLLLLLLSALVPSQALGAAYGEGDYGAEAYNVGAEPTSDGSQTTSGTADSSVSEPGCSDQAPGSKAPWLYAAVAQSGTSVELYFAEPDGPYDHYALEYGTSPGNYQWGATNIGGKGTRTYQVTSLSPNTAYYFRVRAGNGCATGPWSNELSATTKGKFSAFATGALDTTSIDVEATRKEIDAGRKEAEELREDASTAQEPTREAETEDQAADVQAGPTVRLKIIDENKEAVQGASVTLHSTPRETTTNENGIARFENVEPGEHRVVIAYNGQTGEQKINIPEDSEVQEIDFTIQLQTTSPFLNPWVIGVVSALALGLVTVSVLFVRSRAPQPH